MAVIDRSCEIIMPNLVIFHSLPLYLLFFISICYFMPPLFPQNSIPDSPFHVLHPLLQSVSIFSSPIHRGISSFIFRFNILIKYFLNAYFMIDVRLHQQTVPLEIIILVNHLNFYVNED